MPAPLSITPFLMQPDPTSTTTTASPGAPAQRSAPSGGTGGMQMQMVMLALMFGVFYFMLIRPQQKRQREVDTMLKALKKGDIVRTSGGIRGEITDMTDTDVTLLIADKVKINVLRSHVAGKGDAALPNPKDKA